MTATEPSEVLRIYPYDLSASAKLAWIYMVITARRPGFAELGHILGVTTRQARSIMSELAAAEGLPLPLPAQPSGRSSGLVPRSEINRSARHQSLVTRTGWVKNHKPGVPKITAAQAQLEGWFTPNKLGGLCECGCGDPAPIARRSARRENKVAGEPMHFIKGHAIRLPENAGAVADGRVETLA